LRHRLIAGRECRYQIGDSSHDAVINCATGVVASETADPDAASPFPERLNASMSFSAFASIAVALYVT
jgi:hypothetical protein